MEASTLTQARVRLLGEELVLTGAEPERLERLAGELDLMLKRLAADAGLLAQPTRAALLVALNLLDELTRLRERQAAFEQSTDSAANSMMKRIDHTLETE
jgi:cell division protein ZapA (FtsZ GTPase activity inhibitor)